MKALLLREYRQLEVVDVPIPEPAPHDVVVQVHACGICGSDIHGFDGSTGRRIPPIIMGHEAAGVVSAVGTKVELFKSGDRVTFDSTISCGQCSYCRSGRINLCDSRCVLGVSCQEYRRDGAFAEYVAVPERVCYKLPDVLPFEHAAMIEAVAVAVHAAGRAPIGPGNTAVVIGAGMIGLLVIQAIRNKGCSSVIAVDLDDTRLAKALTLGADYGLNPNIVDVPTEVRKATTGQGADVVLEVVGAATTFQTAVACTRKGSAITLVGNLTSEVPMSLQSIVTRELTLFGSCASSGEYPTCLELMKSGKILVQPLISATASLNEGSAWFDRLYRGGMGDMKVILRPTGC